MQQFGTSIGVGDGGTKGHVPPKIREKYFSGNYYVKFRPFSGKKNHVKFGNFVNLSGKYHNKKLSYCWETVRRESMPRIAEMDVEMTT